MKLSLAALSVAAVALGSMTGCSGASEKVGSSGQAVEVCAGGSVVKGVDVSTYDGTVNWTAAHAAGLGFAIARVSDGTGYPDDTFATNWAGIKAAGMVRGVYQFFRASEDPTAQANLLVDAVGSLGAGDLPPIADVEVMDGESGATLVANLATWISVVKAKLGRTPMIYASPGFWEGLPSTSQFAAESSWVANWGVSCPETASPWTTWSIWQSSDTGTVAGISDAVDLDEFNGTLAELDAFAGGASSGGGGGSGSGSSGGGAGASDAGTPLPPSTSCYSATLGQTVVMNTCVETDDAGTWVQCDDGAWVERWDDPTACGATYPFGNGGHSSGGGAGCYSSTLGANEPDNACVQSRANDAWFQCDNGTWVDRWTDPTACNGVYAL